MKNLFRITLFAAIAVFMMSCGGKPEAKTESTETKPEASTTENGNPSYDPNRGEGKFNNVEVGATLDATMADGGNKVFDVKCASCHKLTDEKLVGPGWAGVTKRRTPTWLMNFITNTDAMLNKDPEAQAQLELCLVRMPNQSLTDEEARQLLEFMRKNDGVK
ncbi:MAG TPA: cytochrome c [Bacteroidia bacterium]|nr:cytochrome c [Bacteroidia bacterium]